MKNEFKHAFSTIAQALSVWWGDWVNQVMVSMLALLASLTLILSPAAIFGILHETGDLMDGTRTGIFGWWKGFKANFWRSLLWGFCAGFGLVIFLFNVWFYINIKSPWAPLFTGIFIVLTLFWIILQFYSLGYLFIQDQKNLWQAWKNSFLTILAAPFFSFTIGALVLILTLISLGLFLPLLLGTPSLLALLSRLAVIDRLEAFGKRSTEKAG